MGRLEKGYFDKSDVANKRKICELPRQKPNPHPFCHQVPRDARCIAHKKPKYAFKRDPTMQPSNEVNSGIRVSSTQIPISSLLEILI